MNKTIKKVICTVVVLALLCGICSAFIITNAEEITTGPVITAEKTAAWTNTDKTEAKINIDVKCDDSNSKVKNVLLLGTLCDGHGMGVDKEGQDTLRKTINTIAAKMNVKYYAFGPKSQKYSSSDVKTGSLKKGQSLSKNFSMDAPRHYAAVAFIDTLYDELVTNENTYDFLFFEYDSSRIAIEISSKLSEDEQKDLTKKMDVLAPVLAKYYTDHKVIWTTDSNKTYSFSNKAPNNRTDQGQGEFGLAKFDFKVLTCIVSPTEYASFDTTYSKYDKSKTYTLKDIDSYSSDIAYNSKISYGDIDGLTNFIKKRMLSQRNDIEIKDTVVDDMAITGVKVQTSADAKIWADYTIETPSTLITSEDKKSVTATIKDFIFEIGTIEYLRLVISVKDTGRFKVSTVKNQYSRDPNNGTASISVKPLGYNETKATPSTKAPLAWEEPIYTLTTNVIGGTTPNALFYAAKGESPISETAPTDDTYVLIYAKVNGTPLASTALANYKESHKYTVSGIAKDTVIDVCYGKPADGTHTPVKKNETTPEPITNKMLTNTNIKVILNDGIWTAPETLDETATSGIYTILGDYNMGTATKTDNVFLGWKVTDGTGDIVKIYEAVFEEDKVGGKTGSDNIPDKYQKLITFKVENGTWDGVADNDDDKTQYVTLKDTSGNWSVDNGKATVTAPSGMEANYGYENGAWATSNPTVTSGSDITITKSTDTTFTFAYTAIGDKDVTFKVPGEEEPGDTKIPYGKKIKIDPAGGTVTLDKEYTEAVEKTIEADFTIPDAAPMTGYHFTGWAETDGTGDVKKVYTAQYEANPVTGKHQPVKTNEDTPKAEEVSVKYDNRVKVILNGGNWTKPANLAETTTSDIYKVAGDYDMGTPTKTDNVFLGWKVSEGAPLSGIIKIYEAVFEEDKVGGKTGSDNIPDKYQKLITFKVENGTWDGVANNDKDKTQYVTLKDTSGNWSVDNGKATVTAPSGMKANYGYENGAWKTSNPTVTSGSDITITKSTDTTFTFAYTAIGDKEVTFKKVGQDTPAKTDIPYGAKIRIVPNGGTVTVNDKDNKTPFDMVIEENFNLPDATPKEGYTFVGWKESIGGGELEMIYTAQYEPIAVKDTYQPKKTGDETPKEVTETNLKYDDKIKVVLNGAEWKVSENLVKTDVPGVYTVKGDFNMACAELEGSTFLGWTVTKGDDGISKVYTAEFETPVIETGDTSMILAYFAVLASLGMLAVVTVMRKKKNNAFER